MKLTVEHILELVNALPKNVVVDYVKPNKKTKAKLTSVDLSTKRIEMARISISADGSQSETPCSFIEDNLILIANKVKEGVPFSIDKIFNNGGNARSVCEAILAQTPEFYKCMVGRNKHLVWRPNNPHEQYVVSELSLDELDAEARDRMKNENVEVLEKYTPYLTALRTKPFLLLAGISGTGKSRIVRELAFATCPKYLQDEDGTTPGNYLMVEVKPNWHDSSSLLGYWSNINDKYMFTPFAEFLVKAMLHPSVPFFVCLDEMNLAPVEQYFAEFLSVLETRRHPAGEETKIQTGRLIEAKYFVDFASMKNFKNSSTGECARRFNNNKEIYQAMFSLDRVENIDEEVGNATTLLTEGLKLPDNVFIIGTVNMDDTTHQFSRKVIDRAMTIEMNGGALEDMFGNDCQLCYREDDDVLPLEKVQPKYITADEVLAQCSTLQQHPEFVELIKGKTEDGTLVEGSLPEKLNKVNIALKNTPFTVSYRVMNELVILLAVLLDNAEEDGIDIDMDMFKRLMNTAFDRILLMKVLPRVEGDDEMFRISARERKQYNLKDTVSDDGENADFTKLDWLKQLAPQHPTETPSDSDTEPTEHESEMQTESPTYMAVDKLDEMIERLRRQNFTRYWP